MGAASKRPAAPIRVFVAPNAHDRQPQSLRRPDLSHPGPFSVTREAHGFERADEIPSIGKIAIMAVPVFTPRRILRGLPDRLFPRTDTRLCRFGHPGSNVSGKTEAYLYHKPRSG